MSIYPGGVNPDRLMYKFEVAAIDLPIPSDLTDRKDAQEWSSYANALSPAQRLRKFGQALDEFHALLDTAPGGDPRALQEDQQITLYSKWLAAGTLNVELLRGIDFDTEETYRGHVITSDIGKGLFCIIDLLKSVQSPDVSKWEARNTRHEAVSSDRGGERKFLNFLGDFPRLGGRKKTGTAPPAP